MASSLFSNQMSQNQINPQCSAGLQLTPAHKQQLDSLMTLINNGQSPNQLVNAMVANNAELQQYMSLLQSGTYKDAALAMARMKGITNPAQVEQMIQQYLKTRQ